MGAAGTFWRAPYTGGRSKRFESLGDVIRLGVNSGDAKEELPGFRKFT